MAPAVRRLESQPVREAAIDPKLKRVVRRITGGLGPINGSKALANSVGVDQGLDIIRIKPLGPGDRESGARRHIIVRHSAPPDVKTVIPDKRGFTSGGALCLTM